MSFIKTLIRELRASAVRIRTAHTEEVITLTGPRDTWVLCHGDVVRDGTGREGTVTDVAGRKSVDFGDHRVNNAAGLTYPVHILNK